MSDLSPIFYPSPWVRRFLETVLIGCVGFKRTRTSLEFFPLESVEKNLKSSKILNVENRFQESSYPRAGVKDRGEVTHLCVDSLYRRKGMGKILMDVMIDWAKECSSNMVTDNKLIEYEIQNTPGRLNEIRVDEVGRMPFGSGDKEIECKESTISLNSIDLTVLTELIPAIELYEHFRNQMAHSVCALIIEHLMTAQLMPAGLNLT